FRLCPGEPAASDYRRRQSGRGRSPLKPAAAEPLTLPRCSLNINSPFNIRNKLAGQRREPVSVTRALTFVLFLTVTPSGQWFARRTPGPPRTPDGKPDLSARAPRTPDGKPDLSGLWRFANGAFTTNMADGMKPEQVRPWVAAAHAKNRDTLGAGFMSVTCMPY